MHARLATTLAVLLLAVSCSQRAPAPAQSEQCPKEQKSITLKAADLTFLAKVGPDALKAQKPVRVATVSGLPDMKLNLACKAISTEETRIHASCRVRGKTADGTGKIHSAPFEIDLLPGLPLQWGSAAEIPVELTIKKNCGDEQDED